MTSNIKSPKQALSPAFLKQLIAAGIIEKPKITDDVFTPEQEREFNRGRSVEEVFDTIAKKYGF